VLPWIASSLTTPFTRSSRVNPKEPIAKSDWPGRPSQ
jgi:hypothetical protein